MKPIRIGLLLPRSTDYPAMAFDIVEGLQCSLRLRGIDSVLFKESNGFGGDPSLTYSKAEKLFMDDDVDVLLIYAGANNAEPLYALAGAVRKAIFVLDAGMQLPSAVVSPYCWHISLQGLHACRIAGQMAGEGRRRVLMTTSFYDGGYTGPYSYDRGLSEAGGSVCGNFVSGYKVSEFNIDGYLSLLRGGVAESVAACFSSYLAELFFKALKESQAIGLPFYCSPFMAEDQLLERVDFPGGEFYAVVPWARSLKGMVQEEFVRTIAQEKGKDASVFHLLGWEAGLLAAVIGEGGVGALDGIVYDSPRGSVHLHPETHYTYAPLYRGTINRGVNGKCLLESLSVVEIDAEMHMRILRDRPAGMVTGWRNNYLCI